MSRFWDVGNDKSNRPASQFFDVFSAGCRVPHVPLLKRGKRHTNRPASQSFDVFIAGCRVPHVPLLGRGKRHTNRPASQSFDVFSATAARISPFSAFSFTLSPSRKSIARLKFPSRLELNSPAGSSRNAPFANVNFTALL